jgi:hypothetical protein
MPLNPRRVEAVFLETAGCDDPVNRAAILERESSADLELRRRVKALLSAHYAFNSLLNDPIVVDRLNAVRRNRGVSASEATR